MRALTRLSGLAAAMAAGAIYFTGCDANGNLDQDFVASNGGQALTAENYCPDADNCAPSGAHAKHGAYACTVCHKVAGRLAFDKTGPAYKAGNPTPTFDPALKTCSNVACHAVPAGTFTYSFPGGDGEPETKTVSYGGTGGNGPTPSWYATAGSGGCRSCHGVTPSNYTWHGFHGGGNGCNLCHPDALNDGSGLIPQFAGLHANGAVDVQGKFKSSCFGCH